MGRQLSDWIDAYLDYTENTEPRQMYRRWAAISAIASAMRRKCYLPWGLEMWFPNLYVVLVGPPAARKGTAMKPAKALLSRLGLPMAADESSRQKLIQRMIEGAEMHTDKEGLTHTHCSMTIFATELTVFLKRDDENMLPTLCKWYDCEDKFEYDTIGRGTETIVNVWVNLFGATTPTLLQTALPSEAFGSGFTSRAIFVFEEDKEKIVIYPGLTQEQMKLQELLLYDLEDIAALCGRYVVAEDFIEAYTFWRTQSEENPPLREPKLATYLQRRPTHLFKLCMIYSASRGNDRVIRLKDFERAAETLQETERKMPWVFRGVGMNPLAEVQSRVMRTILESGEIHMADLQQMFLDDVDSKSLWQIVATLEQTRFCKMDLNTKTVKCTRDGLRYLGRQDV